MMRRPCSCTKQWQMSFKFCIIIERNSQKTFFAIVLYTNMAAVHHVKTENTRDVFRPFGKLQGTRSEFWLVHRAVCSCCDSSEWLLWYRFFDGHYFENRSNIWATVSMRWLLLVASCLCCWRKARYKWTGGSAVEVNIENDRFTMVCSRCR